MTLLTDPTAPLLRELAPLPNRPATVCIKNLLAREFGRDSPISTATPAAQYIRMSTDHQDCSPEVQRTTIADYASANNLAVIKTYADEGISGLTLHHRPGLRALLQDVADGVAEYLIILVYDVSRWGRFQDCDESAHYEFLCRRAGIRVEYCAEPFRNDNTPYSTVMKSLKRIMAGEYSRELSQKVFRAKCWRTTLGQRQGGAAGFGYRRVLLSADGKPIQRLEKGEYKHLHSDRVTLMPGPAGERRIVQWIFRQVADKSMSATQIARALNAKGVKGPFTIPWKDGHVCRIIGNEKYIGHLVFNRSSMKLQTKRTRNPRETWVRCENAHPPIVDPELFYRAQRSISQWSTRISNEDAIERLKELHAREGKLSTKLISESGLPGPHLYASRFGSLTRAYKLIGFTPYRDMSYMRGFRWRRRRNFEYRAEVERLFRERNVPVRWESRQVIVLNETIRVAVMQAVGKRLPHSVKWSVQLHMSPPAWVLVERLAVDAEAVMDYWLVPGGPGLVLIGAKHRIRRERHQSATLEPLVDVLTAKVA